MTLKLYFDLLSPPSRALYIFLKKCDIPFEKNVINLGKREQFTKGYEKIHPFNKIPAIVHNGFHLTESATILRYLSREFKVDDHWYPKDFKARARVDENLDWQLMNSKVYFFHYFKLKFLDPLFEGKFANPKELAESKDRMINCLNQVENVWLENKDYLTSNEISIADIIGACDIQQSRLAGFDPRDGRPKITAWLKRVARDVSPFYEEAHEHMHKLAKHSERTNSKL